ncbi:MAG: hypothetical protein ABSG04_14055 [Verrucomicrobiota bacterium]|jgi:hypothetical protein
MSADPSQSQPPSETPALPELPNWLCLSLLAVLTLAVFSEVLLVRPGEVLSDGQMDLGYFFVHWRCFGFQEMASGNLALWNPHCLSGTPFFGNFQSALLYPLNFLYLLLPLAAAINWGIALHVFLGGVFTFYWMRHRGLHSLACLLAAVIFMFCGPHFLQVHAGHLPNLCTLIWAPLLFLAIDRMLDRPALPPCLLGMFALAMSVFAGHPQFVFYMGVAAAIYVVLNCLRHWPGGQAILGLAAMGLGGVALSAVQLFTGLGEGAETMRSVGMSYDFASSFSFPPENFLTLLAPWFFGDMKNDLYWGRWTLTEVSLFVSVMGLVLAGYGMARGRPATRRFSITMLLLALVLALGGYTPLFRLLYNYVPGFNVFRGMDKFLWLAALFLAALAGIGLDQMLRRQAVPRWLMAGAAGLGVALCALAFLPARAPWWSDLLQSLHPLGSVNLPEGYFKDPLFISHSQSQASWSLAQGGFSLFLAAALLAGAGSRRRLACGAVILLTVIELAGFAATSLVAFTISPAYSPAVESFLAQHPGDYRLRHFNPNTAMTTGALDISGDDPAGLTRYMRFLYFSAGIDFDTAQPGNFAQQPNTNVLRMLRLRYLFSDDERTCTELAGGLPHLLLVDRFRVLTNYHEIFSTLANENFKMDQEVILESPPTPLPQPARDQGTVRLLESSTDYLKIQAEVGAPALLLITDSYSRGWRALALPGSSQAAYQVMPANYCLRVIPLAAGRHLLRVEYSPPGFRLGKVVSIAALALFMVLTTSALKNRRLLPRRER